MMNFRSPYANGHGLKDFPYVQGRYVRLGRKRRLRQGCPF